MLHKSKNLRLENQRDLQVIAAKLKAYSEADSGEAGDGSRTARSEVANCPVVPHKDLKREQTCKNNTNEQTDNTNNEASLVQALHGTVVLTRLPALLSGSTKEHRVAHKSQGTDRTAMHKSS